MTVPNASELLDLSKFPGRFPGEHEVIADWLPTAVSFYDRIAFDVRLGMGAQPPAGMKEPWLSQAIERTQKRADIIAWLPGGIVIIEAKRRATSDALGQLISYKTLWLEANPLVPVLALEVICREINADDQFVFTNNGVTVRIFEPATS